MDKKQLNNEICAVINRAVKSINSPLDCLKRHPFYTDRFCYLATYDIASSKKLTACAFRSIIALANESLRDLEEIDEN